MFFCYIFLFIRRFDTEEEKHFKSASFIPPTTKYPILMFSFLFQCVNATNKPLNNIISLLLIHPIIQF